MKKVLLLGGAGFIGLSIAEILAGKKYDVTIADNFFRGKRDERLQALMNQGVKVIEGDFTNTEAFLQLDDDYDYVYMLASVVGVKYTEEIPNELIRINTSLILYTLEWIKNTKCKKVIFTSTSENYAGTIESFNYAIPTPETVPLCISDISHPRFTYAVTKMLGESGFLNYAKVYGFECTIVRYHNVYGPRMGFKHVVPQVIQRFLANENPFKIYGFDQTRSFNYITDAALGTILAMESPNTNGQIYHIGDTAEITIKELVEYIGSLFDYTGSYEYLAAPSGSVSRRCPDISKAKKELNYSPEIDWRSGVEKTTKWYTDYLKAGKDVFE